MQVVEIVDPWVGPAVRVSIFLSPLDVHVNRSPVAAVVEGVQHATGRFLAAYRDEASELNERCTLALQGEAARVGVKQIAGVLARRIVCRARQGDKLQAGERYGLIRFGSRTDLVVPKGTEIRVRVGDRVRGGETSIRAAASSCSRACSRPATSFAASSPSCSPPRPVSSRRRWPSSSAWCWTSSTARSRG
jgi:phosphatidylserine decarboxylase precursor-related protein